MSCLAWAFKNTLRQTRPASKKNDFPAGLSEGNNAELKKKTGQKHMKKKSGDLLFVCFAQIQSEGVHNTK